MELAERVEAEAVLADPVTKPTTTSTMAGNSTRRPVLVGRDCRFLLPAALLSTLLEVMSRIMYRLSPKTQEVVEAAAPESQDATESLSSPIKGRRSLPSVPA
jgi:hypothetical protein